MVNFYYFFTVQKESGGIEQQSNDTVGALTNSTDVKKGKTKAKKKHPIVFWSGIAIVLLALVVTGSVAGYLQFTNDEIHHVNVRHLTPIPTKGVDANTENILLIGSTSRCALNGKQAGAFGSCANGVTGINADVIMILRIDPSKNRVSLISVPRDSFLINARPNEDNKIDSALVYGPSQLVLALEQDMGITIQHFAELNFDSFQAIVKSLGGLSMWFPDPVKDAVSGLNVPVAGCYKLGAFQALALVRARHMYYYVKGHGWEYDGSGDLGRIIRVHEFLRVLSSQVLHHGIKNVTYDNALVQDIAPQLTVDQGFTPHDMFDLITQMRSMNPYRVPESTLPVMNDPTYTYIYQGNDYGNVVFAAEPQDLETITAWLGHKVPGATLSPKTITVSVLGGVGNPAETAQVAAQLRTLGFDVIATGEQTPVGPVSEASVLYKSPAFLPDGNRVLETLNGAVAIGQNKTFDNADVTVLTGTNFTVDTPKAAATTLAKLISKTPIDGQQIPSLASSYKSSTSNQAGQSKLSNSQLAQLLSMVIETSAPYLDPPTSATTPLPSYDPRACPAKDLQSPSSYAHLSTTTTTGKSSVGSKKKAKSKSGK